MDVLHLIKEDHGRIHELLTATQAARGARPLRAAFSFLKEELSIHLHLEDEYLFPEVDELLNGEAVLLKPIHASRGVISKLLSKTDRAINGTPFSEAKALKALEELSKLLKEHFASEEELLMPKIRTLLPTQEREELGLVFLDVRAESQESQAAAN